MDSCIHWWVSNERGDQRRGRYTSPLPRRTESLSERGCGKALLKLPCRNRSPHTGCLHSPGFRSRLQTSCIPRWRTLRPAGIPKPQAPKPDQSPTTSRNYQEGCSAVDSSPLWNIRQWASGHPGKGGCQRRTACQQCQLQWKEDSHQSTYKAKIRGMTTTCCPGSNRSFWWGFTPVITDWTVICTVNWSWHPHQLAPVVEMSRPRSMFYKDAPFTKPQEKTCGLSALPWRPNSTAANRSWRRRHHSSPEQPWSCRLQTPRRRR